jgi:hypothetical protein
MKTIIVCVADLHIGSTLALSPASWMLHDDTPFTPSPLQTIIRDHWLSTWDKIGIRRKGARLVVVVVGDVIEGMHHDTSQVITGRLDTQEAMAASVIEEGLEHARYKRGDVIRFVTGTPAHDGPGAASCERVARLVTDYTGDGRCTVDYWRGRVDGVLFDVAHQPGSGPGSRSHVRGNAFQMWLKSLYYTALECGSPVPRYVIRAHRHAYLERHVWNASGELALTGYILAAWQAKSEYVYKVMPEALTSIGALVVEVEDGRATACCERLALEQDRIEELG